MIQAILISGALFTLLVLNVLTLAAVGRLLVETRDKFDAFLGFAQVAIRSSADLQEQVQNSMDCLLSVDAALDIVKNSKESGVSC